MQKTFHTMLVVCLSLWSTILYAQFNPQYFKGKVVALRVCDHTSDMARMFIKVRNNAGVEMVVWDYSYIDTSGRNKRVERSFSQALTSYVTAGELTVGYESEAVNACGISSQNRLRSVTFGEF